MIKVVCLNCRLKLKDKLFVTNGYTFFTCKNCGLIQIYPIPQKSKREQFYPYKSSLNHLRLKNPYYKFFSRFPFVRILHSKYQKWITSARHKYIIKLKKGGRLLDIGCSEGDFLQEFDAKKWQLVGVDINKTAAKIAQSKLGNAEIYARPIKAVKLPKKTFDIITLWHVFEHLDRPKSVLKEIHSLLDPNGYVIIEVPNGNSLYRRLFGPNWQLLIAPEHICFWSKRTITDLFQKLGFSIKQVSYSGVFSFSASSSIGNLLRSRGINTTLSILLATFILPLAIFVNFFSFSLRENMLIVAKKTWKKD